MKRGHVAIQDVLGLFVTLSDDLPDLVVDQSGRLFTVVPVSGKFPSEKDLFFLLSTSEGPILLLIPIRRPFSWRSPWSVQYRFLRRSSGAPNEFLRGPPSHHDGDVVEEVVFG